MFDFAWTEIALIGVVALVLIGPKDMPVAIKAVTTMIRKARRMAAEFQTHVDDMVKDTELQDVRNSLRDIRGMDIRGAITRAVDKDGTIRSAMADPMRAPPPALPDAVADASSPQVATVVEPRSEHTIAAPSEMPAFIPPEGSMLPAPARRETPAFIPPGTTPPDDHARLQPGLAAPGPAAPAPTAGPV